MAAAACLFATLAGVFRRHAFSADEIKNCWYYPANKR
jgi:hypothetical protein